MGPSNHVLYGGAHWRRLANTSEQSVRGGNAALCQITLTTCYCIPADVMMRDSCSTLLWDLAVLSVSANTIS